MVGTDPGGSEKYKYDFQNLEDRSLREYRFARPAGLLVYAPSGDRLTPNLLLNTQICC